jgi:hypothetical protein
MTMARVRSFFLIALMALIACGYAVADDPCAKCHKDFAKVLPPKHVEVKGGFAECIACHDKGQSGVAEKNAFGTRIHLQHVSKQKMECAACHSFMEGKSFGLIGDAHSWGAPKSEDMRLMKQKMQSWSSSTFTDNMHAKASVDCAGCHGKELPGSDATVENDRCLSCHGPVEKLAAKSANAQFPKRNPHASHYGNDIACSTCHHAHEASVVMCADCHKLWKLDIPGAAS